MHFSPQRPQGSAEEVPECGQYERSILSDVMFSSTANKPASSRGEQIRFFLVTFPDISQLFLTARIGLSRVRAMRIGGRFRLPTC